MHAWSMAEELIAVCRRAGVLRQVLSDLSDDAIYALIEHEWHLPPDVAREVRSEAARRPALQAARQS
jgi:cytochrome c553